MTDWLERVLDQTPGFERELVDRYTGRLLDLARRQMPDGLRRRIDPEDVVQSVYRSFFQRLKDGRFSFEDSQDLWRLLAVMTFNKASNARKFHLRGRRDVRRDLALTPWEETLATPQTEDVGILYELLEQLMRGLPDNHTTIVALRLQGASIESIAQQVRRSQRTVLRVLAHVAESAARLQESPS